ncbi:hypothetical protein [Paracoccus zhejiangensis]|uniref:Uncharacterized protein n=1 Tax=Paracoccus zhejiangensis TaxID=1077935 RepID=A0A2H5F5L1_9RHOB|nr:hypothetical protein [Paracoccus zhejiangensis]AUH66833.1 hypothetical protein CX676_21285 [Paracoccus zhejiangensis]
MTNDFKQSDYLKEKAWHGLSCCCGGGYRVGHALGCPDATRAANLSCLAVDLDRAEAAGDQVEIADLRRIKAEIEALATKYPDGY